MQFAAPAEQCDRFMGRYAPTLSVALENAAGVTADMRVLDVGCGPGAARWRDRGVHVGHRDGRHDDA